MLKATKPAIRVLRKKKRKESKLIFEALAPFQGDRIFLCDSFSTMYNKSGTALAGFSNTSCENTDKSYIGSTMKRAIHGFTAWLKKEV